MHCHYHEAGEAVKACARCGKQLCEQCFHADHPEYCWSCGLEHSNDLVERDKAFRKPAWLTGPKGIYFIAKLAAAGGTYVTLSVVIGIIFGMMEIKVLFIAGIIAAYFSAGVIYTYGIAYSMLVDWMMRISRLKLALVEALLYFIGGLIFQQLFHMNVWLGFEASDWGGILSALIFFGMNRWFMRRRNHTSTFAVAVLALIPALFLMLLYVVGFIQS